MRDDISRRLPVFEVKIKPPAEGVKVSTEYVLKSRFHNLWKELYKENWRIVEERKRERTSWSIRLSEIDVDLDWSYYSDHQQELDIELVGNETTNIESIKNIYMIAASLGFPTWRLTTKGFSARQRDMRIFGSI